MNPALEGTNRPLERCDPNYSLPGRPSPALFCVWHTIRRMTLGLGCELVDSARGYSRALNQFREDVAISRFGPRPMAASLPLDGTVDES